LQIPPYQIQNVLKLYFRQLGEGKILGRTNKSGTGADTFYEGQMISSEGSRQAIIDKVAADIVKQIITQGSKKENTAPDRGTHEQTAPRKRFCSRAKIGFTYILVDRHNNRKIQTAEGIWSDPVQHI
jgi:hypothetical protein